MSNAAQRMERAAHAEGVAIYKKNRKAAQNLYKTNSLRK